LIIDSGEKERGGVVDARGPTRRVLTQVFHEMFDDLGVCITFVSNYIV
jgi:hypothetical protein